VIFRAKYRFVLHGLFWERLGKEEVRCHENSGSQGLALERLEQ
jgi:hypothetical protein